VDRHGAFPPLQPDSRSALESRGPRPLAYGATARQAVHRRRRCHKR
jgi:hypothetical protein